MIVEQNGESQFAQSMRDLIERQVPEHRENLEQSFKNLENVAAYCEEKYLTSDNKDAAFNETKQYALQSLASVAYQINQLSRGLLDMLNMQTEKFHAMAHKVDNIDMEKLARREIGVLTTNKSIPKQPKIISPAIQPTVTKYRRTPIDYSVLDSVGHGARMIEQPRAAAVVTRAPSSVSCSNGSHHSQYGNPAQYGQYERTATLGRSSMRSGLSMAPSDYRIPQVMPSADRLALLQHQNSHSDYGSHPMSLPNSAGGSQHGSSDYGAQMGPLGDRYGTLRANQNGIMNGGSLRQPLELGRNYADARGLQIDSRFAASASDLPLPPSIIDSRHADGDYGYGSSTLTRQSVAARADLPPPPSELLSSTIDDDLPAPPPSMAPFSSAAYGTIGATPNSAPISQQPPNFFDTNAEWVTEGNYLEKAIALYDYEAEKPDELSLRENCVVYVLRKNDDGWYEAVLDGVTGLCPGNYLQKIN